MRKVTNASQSRRATAGVLSSFFAFLLGLIKPIAAEPPRPPAVTDAQALLLDGVRAFRAERYEESLQIFRRVEATEQPLDIGFYLGMSLHHLGRHGEALAAFRSARRAGLREPMADYYQAVSCYRLGMLTRAQKGFLSLVAPPGPSSGGTPLLGPRLQQGAQRFLLAIEQALGEQDLGKRQAVHLRRYEAALQRAQAVGGDGQALEWLDEAVQILTQAPEHAEQHLALRQEFLKVRDALRGKPAEADVLALWAQLGTGDVL